MQMQPQFFGCPVSVGLKKSERVMMTFLNVLRVRAVVEEFLW
jgi:hypothetical protein